MPKRRDVPSKQDLMQVARQLGYRSRSEAVQVLRNNGVEGNFDPAKFGEYVAILTTHAETLASIMNKLDPKSEKKGSASDGSVREPSGKLVQDGDDLPARATRILKDWGQRPWLLRPVAKDEHGHHRFLESREELEEGEELVYEGVTKKEHLEAIHKEMDNAVGSGELAPGPRGDSGVDDEPVR